MIVDFGKSCVPARLAPYSAGGESAEDLVESETVAQRWEGAIDVRERQLAVAEAEIVRHLAQRDAMKRVLAQTGFYAVSKLGAALRELQAGTSPLEVWNEERKTALGQIYVGFGNDLPDDGLDPFEFRQNLLELGELGRALVAKIKVARLPLERQPAPPPRVGNLKIGTGRRPATATREFVPPIREAIAALDHYGASFNHLKALRQLV